jgi:hypothetical protein
LAVRAWDDLHDVGESFLQKLHGQRAPTTEAADTDREDPSARAAELHDELDAFGRRLRARFAAAGIDVSVPIQLKSDGRNGVIVAGSHPQRAEIEQLFAAGSELTSTFHYLEAAFNSEDLLRAEAGGRRFGEYRLQITDRETDVVFE